MAKRAPKGKKTLGIPEWQKAKNKKDKDLLPKMDRAVALNNEKVAESTDSAGLAPVEKSPVSILGKDKQEIRMRVTFPDLPTIEAEKAAKTAMAEASKTATEENNKLSPHTSLSTNDPTDSAGPTPGSLPVAPSSPDAFTVAYRAALEAARAVIAATDPDLLITEAEIAAVKRAALAAATDLDLPITEAEKARAIELAYRIALVEVSPLSPEKNPDQARIDELLAFGRAQYRRAKALKAATEENNNKLSPPTSLSTNDPTGSAGPTPGSLPVAPSSEANSEKPLLQIDKNKEDKDLLQEVELCSSKVNQDVESLFSQGKFLEAAGLLLNAMSVYKHARDEALKNKKSEAKEHIDATLTSWGELLSKAFKSPASVLSPRASLPTNPTGSAGPTPGSLPVALSSAVSPEKNPHQDTIDKLGAYIAQRGQQDKYTSFRGGLTGTDKTTKIAAAQALKDHLEENPKGMFMVSQEHYNALIEPRSKLKGVATEVLSTLKKKSKLYRKPSEEGTLKQKLTEIKQAIGAGLERMIDRGPKKP